MNVTSASRLHHDQRVREDRGLGVEVRQRLQRQLDLDAGRHVQERPPRAERGVQGGELGAVGRDEAVQVGLDELGAFGDRAVQVAEPDALAGEDRVEMGDHHLGVPLDLQPCALAHLACGREDLLGHLVQVLGAAALDERPQVEPEALQVRVAPLLGLLRRDRQGLERLERLRADRVEERRRRGKPREGVLVEPGGRGGHTEILSTGSDSLPGGGPTAISDRVRPRGARRRPPAGSPGSRSPSRPRR